MGAASPVRVPCRKNRKGARSRISPRPVYQGLLFARKGIVIRLNLGGHLDTLRALFLLQRRALLDGEHTVALDLGNDLVAVFVAPVLGLGLGGETDSVGALLGVLEREHGAALLGRATGADDVCGRVGVGVGGADGEGTTVLEGAANGEDDTEGHRGREYGSHARYDGPNWVVNARWLDDEPEEHVDHVHKPNCGVEVQTIAKHQLPVGDLLDLERLERALKGEDEGSGIKEGGR